MKSARLGSLVYLACWTLVGVVPSAGLAQAEKPGGKKPAQAPVVKKILEVQYAEQEIEPPNLVVTAVGQVPTAGYRDVQLVRVRYTTPPKDGIQDYYLRAMPPSGIAAQVISKVKASDTWKAYRKEAPWIKGVRVHGVDGGVVVKMFSPGK